MQLVHMLFECNNLCLQKIQQLQSDIADTKEKEKEKVAVSPCASLPKGNEAYIPVYYIYIYICEIKFTCISSFIPHTHTHIYSMNKKLMMWLIGH